MKRIPPSAAVSLGYDRFLMLLTGSHNIREVVFFPLKRGDEKCR
jgi:lysyl-tRNA synthetase class II